MRSRNKIKYDNLTSIIIEEGLLSVIMEHEYYDLANFFAWKNIVEQDSFLGGCLPKGPNAKDDTFELYKKLRLTRIIPQVKINNEGSDNGKPVLYKVWNDSF